MAIISPFALTNISQLYPVQIVKTFPSEFRIAIHANSDERKTHALIFLKILITD